MMDNSRHKVSFHVRGLEMSKKQRECNKKDSVMCLPSDRWGVGGCFREELSLSGTGLQNDTLRRADFLLICFSVDLADLPPTNNKYITYPLIQNKNQETNQNYSKYLYIWFFQEVKSNPKQMIHYDLTAPEIFHYSINMHVFCRVGPLHC